MGNHTLTIHGHKVYCDDEMDYHGVKHLAYEIDEEACLDLFKQARENHEVDFEDDHDRQFSLVEGENLSFTVVSRERHHGWI